MPHSNINIRLFCSNEKNISKKDIRVIEQTIWDDIRNKAKKEGIIVDFFLWNIQPIVLCNRFKDKSNFRKSYF